MRALFDFKIIYWGTLLAGLGRLPAVGSLNRFLNISEKNFIPFMCFYAFQSESVILALDEMFQVQTFPGINAESFIFL